ICSCHDYSQNEISEKLDKQVVALHCPSFQDGRALKCAYQEQSEQFCRRVNESYQLNNSTEHLLSDYTFRDARERVRVTERKIIAVLKQSEKSALTTALCSALGSEIDAVFILRVGCKGSQIEKDACNLGIPGLCLGMEEMVKASMEITEVEKKDQIKNVLEGYEAKNKTDRLEWANLAIDLGKNVSRILHCAESHNV
ncbi:unnamed protein product, partial [Nippostrongylus brasiliensis]|uniref:PNP_UDP_1 domain-containing protein n=1 Tax=Nippostrongylus brasiliensis TaxID=27835 RepID=A0A0N4XPB8_NIPBR